MSTNMPGLQRFYNIFQIILFFFKSATGNTRIDYYTSVCLSIQFLFAIKSFQPDIFLTNSFTDKFCGGKTMLRGDLENKTYNSLVEVLVI